MTRLVFSAETLGGDGITEKLSTHAEISRARRDELFRRREAAEPTAKACGTCGETKPADEYRKVPVGGRANTCYDCLNAKQTKEQRRMEDPNTVIAEELWRQYDGAETTGEKIRCLEALTKLQGGAAAVGDPNSKLSEPAVVANLMKRLKAKRAVTSGQ